MKVVLLLILGLFTTSCVTYKACSTKFNWQSDTIRTVVYRDTIIPVLIHGTDTIYAVASVHDTLIIHNGTAHSQIYVVHDTIRANVWSSDTIIRVRLDSALKVITVNNKQMAVRIEEGRGAIFLNKLFACLLIIAIIALIIVVVPRLFKKKG